jgi:purine-binding chemotaxis protein CheW
VSPEPSGLFCTFYVDGMYFGVDVMEVQEVIRYQEMTDVPLAPDIVRGLINLRGQIVTAIDLRKRLGIEAERTELPMNVVIRSGDEAVSLLVDEIGDVVETDPADREDPPPTLAGPARELVASTYKLPGRLLLILDVDRALTPEPAR